MRNIILSSVFGVVWIGCSGNGSSQQVTSTTTVQPTAGSSGSSITPNQASDDSTTTSSPSEAASTLTTEAPSVIPSWLRAGDLRTQLEQALEARAKILASTKDELATKSAEPYTDVFTPLNAAATFVSEGSFTEILDSSISIDGFRAASPQNACTEIFSLFWVKRPIWLIPSLQDAGKFRACVEELRTSLASMPESPNSLIQISCLKDWLNVAYSAQMELFVRNKASILDNMPDWGTRVARLPLMVDYLNGKPILKALIDPVDPDIENIFSLLNPQDRMYLEQVIQGNDVHVGDFIDYVWSEQAVRANGATMISLWSYLVQRVHEGKIFDFDAQKISVIQSPKYALEIRVTQYRAGMGAARSAWLGTVGNLLGVLFSVSPDAVTACFPEDSKADIPNWPAVYYNFEDNPNSVLTVYRCLTDAIGDGRISVRADDYESIGTILHLVRITTSAVALALGN